MRYPIARLACLLAGWATLLSLALFAFAGVPLWEPVRPDEHGREFLLILLHFAGLVAGAAGLFDANWPRREREK